MRITETQLRRVIREELKNEPALHARDAIIFPEIDGFFRVIAYNIDALEKSMQEKYPEDDFRGVLGGVAITPPTDDFGPCNGTWQVATAAVKMKRQGWGTKIYTAALTRIKRLSSDRTDVSPEAESLWKNMSTLKRFRQEPFDDITLPQTPPTDDDCTIHYERDPAINRSYRLVGPPPPDVLDLIDRGTRHMEELRERGIPIRNRAIRMLVTGYSILFSKQHYG